MKITAYLNFNGQCAEALAFYEELLGGKITFMQTHGDSPMKDMVPAEWGHTIMHATLMIGEESIMASDAPPPMYKQPQGFAVSIGVSEVDDAERIYAGLAKGGFQTMALQETFWAKRFGMVTDRFGIPWMVNCENVAP